MAKPLVASTLTDAQFDELAGRVFSVIETSLDRWLQEDVVDIDSQRAGGMLELAFPDGSKIVINTQRPLHELWMAARSGGYHYRHAEGRWRDTRDAGEFFAALSQAASEQAGVPLRFEPLANA